MSMILTHPKNFIADRDAPFGSCVKTMLGVLCLVVLMLPAMLFAEESDSSYTNNWQSADNERLLNQNQTDHGSISEASMNIAPLADSATEDPDPGSGDELLANPDEGQLMDAAARPVTIPTYGASSR